MKLAKGAMVPVELASGLLKPYGVVVDQGWVYWTNGYGGGTVQKVPK
jgi:hypothetical protein